MKFRKQPVVSTDVEINKILTAGGWKFYGELNGYRKESKFTIPMFSADQSISYDSLSHGNYLELRQSLVEWHEKQVEDVLSRIENPDRIGGIPINIKDRIALERKRLNGM